MSAPRTPGLAWYPAEWRERYGDELAALTEDLADGGMTTGRLRWSLVVGGLRERVRQGALVGDWRPPAERVRTGALVVLFGWAVFVAGGSLFQRASEHYDSPLGLHARGVPDAAFMAVVGTSVLTAAVIALGALGALPTFIRFLRAGGWSQIARPVRGAALASVVAVALTGGTVVAAHHLSSPQRNGGLWWYTALFLAAAVALEVALVAWTAAVATTVRRLALSRALLRLESGLALAAALGMAVMTGATALWWAAMARSVPWWLTGSPRGTSPSPMAANLAVAGALMVLTTAAAAYGSLRIVSGWRASPAPDPLDPAAPTPPAQVI